MSRDLSDHIDKAVEEKPNIMFDICKGCSKVEEYPTMKCLPYYSYNTFCDECYKREED